MAFGEIIKNLLNSFYVGRDASGFHVSLKDALSLNLDETGDVIINGAQGITGMPRSATFGLGFVLILITLFIVLNLINSRTGRADYVHPGQPHRSGIRGRQCHAV